MKNVIKKIASIAMAFVLFGTGIAVTKTISPKSDNTIVADAANTCKHKCRTYVTEYRFLSYQGKLATEYTYKVQLVKTTKCSNCNYPFKTVYEKQDDFKASRYLGQYKEVYGNWEKFKEQNKFKELNHYASKYTVQVDVNCVKTTGGFRITSPERYAGSYTGPSDGVYNCGDMTVKISVDPTKQNLYFSAKITVDKEF